MEKPRPDIQSGDILAFRYEGGFLLREWFHHWTRVVVREDEIVPPTVLNARLDALRSSGDTFVQDESGAFQLVEYGG
jgi:hypothetical protein